MENFLQAWGALSSLKLSSRNYSKPGKMAPLLKDASVEFPQDVRKCNLQSSHNTNNQYLEHNLPHQNLGETNSSYSETASCRGNSFRSGSACAENAGREGGQNETKPSMLYNSHIQVVGQSSGTCNVHTGQVKELVGAFPNGTDDDDILEVIHAIFVKQQISICSSVN